MLELLDEFLRYSKNSGFYVRKEGGGVEAGRERKKGLRWPVGRDAVRPIDRLVSPTGPRHRAKSPRLQPEEGGGQLWRRSRKYSIRPTLRSPSNR